MSVEKNMNTRIQHKHDIEANWNKALNFIPKAGEIIIYDIDENYTYSRIKIGDGIRTISNLEFSQTDLTGYATESYVDEAIGSIPEPDMSSKQDKLVGAQGQIVGFDENGNAVAQDAPESVTSWNDLTDKPFGETATGGDTIYTPDDLSGLVTVNSSMGTIYKISDVVPSYSELENGGIITKLNGVETSYYIMGVEDAWAVVYGNDGDVQLVVAYQNNVSSLEGTLPSVGIYVPVYGAVCSGVSSFTVNGFTGFPGIKKLDSKYLDIDIDDYQDAILLDGETLKDISGKDITEDVKVIVDTWKANNISVSPPSSERYWGQIFYCDNKFVAFSDDGVMAQSKDFSTWTEHIMSAPVALGTITYGGGKFVSIGFDETKYETTASYSSDGINWFTDGVTAPICNSNVPALISYGDGKFVSILGSNMCAAKSAYSMDGISWTTVNITTSEYPEELYFGWSAMSYGDGKFVCVCNDEPIVIYSEDGIHWNQTTMPCDGHWTDMTFGRGKFVAVSSGMQDYPQAYSEDGVNWVGCNSQLWYAANAVVCYNDKFVAVGEKILYSNDGLTWDIATTEFGDDISSWNYVVCDENKFIINGNSYTTGSYGVTLYSTDGTNWNKELKSIETASGKDITEDIRAIVAPTVAGNVGDFVVIGEDGKLTAKTIAAAEGVSF